MLDTLNPKAEIARSKADRSSETGDIQALLGVGTRRRFGRFGWRPVLWLAAAAALAVGVYVFWSLNGSRAAVTYVTEPVTRGNLTVLVTATGSAQPITQVNISSELSGTVRNVLVDYNTQVTTGQVLAELDMDKLKAAVDNARAKLAVSNAKVAEAAASILEKRALYERRLALAAKQAVSAEERDLAKSAYDKAIAQHDSAIADVNVAEADLRVSEINLTKASIRSPIDGVILTRNVDPGQIVASSLQAPVLFVIAEDLRRMELRVDVDEADVGKIKIAHQATFNVDAYPERKFPAEIKDIRYGSEVVQGVVTYKAILSIDNSELLIRPGMTATAEIVVQHVSDALLVPNPALRFTPAATQGRGQQRSFLQRLLPGRPPFRPPSKQQETDGANRTVWTLSNGVPAAIRVVIGATDGRRTEIIKGNIAADQGVIVDAVAARR
jgi:HlyD family secretion protein